ncbi:MAG TPA: ABC transporter permease [Candidatus Deferrimicrobium sp.]|nr:ABC transporter permease [Candidatus Kapabacteria bacterium]HLP59178.1 ABC transporter permease [Candidatus Deferrimicrobium sp.]
MIRNYLLEAFRNIKKHIGYSIINILGLAIGIACCILIVMWLQDELSFDKFHENADEIYRVITKRNIVENVTQSVRTPTPLGPILKDEFPEITNFTRMSIVQHYVVQCGEKRLVGDQIAMADPAFFEVFSFPIVKGNPKTVFNDKRSLVVTEGFAKKYFGDEEPMAKVIKINGFDFKITGVMKNICNNSHLKFDCIFPIRNIEEFNHVNFTDWKGLYFFQTYIQIRKGASWKELEKKISGIVMKHDPESKVDIYLQPLKDIHLKSNFELDIYNNNQGNITYVYLLSALALCILFIACFNYTNLSIARSSDRAKGIAVRKIVGATRMDNIKQLLGEAVILSFISLIFALILVYFFLPAFNNMSGKRLAFSSLGTIPFILRLLILTILTGIISGSYPTFILSAFQPINILKGVGSMMRKRGTYLRKALVVVQFAVAIFLILITIVIYSQLGFIKTKDLGFNPHNVITFFSAHQIEENFESKKSLFLSNPNVLNFCNGAAPMFLYESETENVSWEGKNPNDKIVMYPSHIDYGYIELYQMKIVEGRSFSRQFSTDNSAYILNETAVKVTGLKSPVGKRFRLNGQEGTIIGVIKDYHYRSLHGKIIPVILMPNYSHGMASIRINPVNVAETLNFLQKTWDKINRSPFPFTGVFVDDKIADLYKAEQKMGMITYFSTLLMLLISCLGLFGLASYTSKQRTKEIGIRKVSGASVSSIVWLVSKEFMKLVIIAFVIACPLALYIMNLWLQKFAYRTEFEWWMFVSTIVIALSISFFTISSQVIKAARTNPVDSLRYE